MSEEKDKATVKDKEKSKTSDKSKGSDSDKSKRTATKLGPELDFSTTEAYNLLRTNLMYSLSSASKKHGHGYVVGTTSPSPQEGKSYTSINLSYSLAEAGNKVLLIDADMRRPSVAKTLKRCTAPGLSNFLAGTSDEVIHAGVLSPNLSVIMAGSIPPNPSELIGSKKMEESLDMFSEVYDFVVVDLPPVNSVSDPIVVSKFLDGILVVARHEHTRRSDVREAVRQLGFAKAHILGFVYNGYSKNIGGGRYKYKSKYRGYYRRYGYSSAHITEKDVMKGPTDSAEIAEMKSVNDISKTK